jgi:hypothetical protein
MHTDRVPFSELARALEISEADCRLLADSCRLPFTSEAGNYWIDRRYLNHWITSAKQVLDC